MYLQRSLKPSGIQVNDSNRTKITDHNESRIGFVSREPRTPKSSSDVMNRKYPWNTKGSSHTANNRFSLQSNTVKYNQSDPIIENRKTKDTLYNPNRPITNTLGFGWTKNSSDQSTDDDVKSDGNDSNTDEENETNKDEEKNPDSDQTDVDENENATSKNSNSDQDSSVSDSAKYNDEEEFESEEDEEDSSHSAEDDEENSENDHLKSVRSNIRPLNQSILKPSITSRKNTTVKHSNPIETDTIIYFRTFANLSHEKKEKMKEFLKVEYPHAKVILEFYSSTTLFDQRIGLNCLYQLIMNERVKKILLANSTHLCKTKEAFQMFEWICSKYDTEIEIIPSLELF
jgi:hypothetical protein